MKFVKANLSECELQILIESLEAKKEAIKNYSLAIDTFHIDHLIKYLRRGLLNTPNGESILDSD